MADEEKKETRHPQISILPPLKMFLVFGKKESRQPAQTEDSQPQEDEVKANALKRAIDRIKKKDEQNED